MQRLGLVVFCTLLSMAAGVTAKGETKLSSADDTLLRRVDDHYNHLRSLRTQFSESYDGMGLHRAESGTLLLSRPGKMRWDYAAPKGKVFVMDGHYAWSYVPGDAQAQRISAKQMDDLRSPLRLLLGHAQLRRELKGILVTTAPDGTATISGAPNSPRASFSRVTLLVSESGLIQRLMIAEVDGATTAFTFKNTQENVPVRDAEFVFTPPIGVPIVDGLPPI